MTESLAGAFESTELDVGVIYRDYADFVWRSLQRLGVRDADLEDLLQDVFVIVHRRLPEFAGASKVSTWLFGICVRVARQHRRLAWIRRIVLPGTLPDAGLEQTPEDDALQRCELERFRRALSRLSPEHHAVFVLFEFEGKSCEQISELMGVPLGTTYSRLHAARQQFEQRFARKARRPHKEPKHEGS